MDPWSVQTPSGRSKLVFLLLSRFPNADIDEMVALTCSNKRTVQDALEELQQAGLARESGPGRWVCSSADGWEQASAADIANFITNKFWSSTKVKPIQGYKAVQKLVGTALLAGWTPAQVQAVLPTLPTFSAKALEFALNRQNPIGQPTRPERSSCETCGGQGRVWRHVQSGTLTKQDRTGDNGWGEIRCPAGCAIDERY